MKIAIAGTGYVGIVTAAVLASTHKVTCVDAIEEKIAKLKEGICPIFEKGLEELLNANKQNLDYTTDYVKAYADAEVIFIAVGTPEKSDGSANLEYVFEVAEQIAQNIKNDCVIVLKSTVPIGTNDIVQLIIKNNLKNNVNFSVVSNPEFLSQGTAVNDMQYANRIIIGAEDEYAIDTMKKVYSNISSPLVITNRKSAEMIKYASNDFLALKLAYINEIANLCEKVGADVEDVSRGMGLDPRISPYFLKAGIGYGGSCFPKDTKALHWISGCYDCEIKTIKAAIEVNEAQKIMLIRKAKNYYCCFKGLKVAVLGLSFKPGTDDLREAPSLDNVLILLSDGAEVSVWDPCAMDSFKKTHPDINYCNSIKDALQGADLCLIMTDWEDIKKLNAEDFTVMKTPIILDGRNCFALDQMKDANVIYESIGRETVGQLEFENKSKISPFIKNV